MLPLIVRFAYNGIDVSSANGEIDFSKVKQDGFDFVYVQSSRYSSTKDSGYQQKVDAARAAGLVVGAYHFCSHDSSPVAQAEFFYHASNGLGNKLGELPPMIDWEFCTPSKYKDHPRHCVDFLETFSSTCKDLWYGPDSSRLPVVYTYPSYGSSHQPALSERTSLGEYPLCYASYKSEPSSDGYRLVGWVPILGTGPIHQIQRPWTTWKLWQYSGDNGLPVSGCTGSVDRQLFNGSSGDWKDFLGLERPVDSIVKDDL